MMQEKEAVFSKTPPLFCFFLCYNEMAGQSRAKGANLHGKNTEDTKRSQR